LTAKEAVVSTFKTRDGTCIYRHGDDDQIVPIAAAAPLAAKLVKGSQLRIYQGAPHGMCTTLKDRVNADLLELIRATA
jgi:non-heme chloroperoxidase